MSVRSISPFSLSGLFLAQIVFWAAFDKIDFLPDRQFIFCKVGIGATIGTLLCLFDKKTPHLSAITNYYKYGIILSLISLISPYDPLVYTFQLILLSAIGGCYLPYVYDIVVGKGGVQNRGTMFACAEVVQGLASIFGMILMTATQQNSVLLFSITSALFLGAHQLQSKEKLR